ncbi:MAG: acyl--CoA ligase [Burkholderiales bacterium]|nr:acyl--CoA ligase [Burkholderiales bacterium]
MDLPLTDSFRDLPALVAAHARDRGAATALICGDERLDWRALDALADRVAASLQRDGLQPRAAIALCAASSIAYVAVFLGALRAGVAVAPLAPGSTAAQLAGMARDADAQRVFIDAGIAAMAVAWPETAPAVHLDDSDADSALSAWLLPPGARPAPVALEPAWPFNIIYSSGTTGTPKGIVQSHAMRWAHVQRAATWGYAADAVTLIATPLYSNTTLVSVIPTLAHGGCAVLMPKFEAGAYLDLAERHRPTHTMLVPVQYQRLMARPDFDRRDLSSFRFKFSTSAPFHAALKADVLARWPGALIEFYGMTEGGGTCILHAHLHPTKLHTVGQPAEGHEIRLIDEAGREVPRTPGGASAGSGEVVGRSPAMMTGYHKQPEQTAAAEWHDAEGRRFIRTGDVGRFDDEGFLILHDRRKDMIISGGFNIYPSDLEAVLRRHPGVAEAAVVGVPSAEWGETPVAFVVPAAGHADTAQALRDWVNAQVGKTQRLSALRLVAELPRSPIGKVLKRELRQGWTDGP